MSSFYSCCVIITAHGGDGSDGRLVPSRLAFTWSPPARAGGSRFGDQTTPFPSPFVLAADRRRRRGGRRGRRSGFRGVPFVPKPVSTGTGRRHGSTECRNFEDWCSRRAPWLGSSLRLAWQVSGSTTEFNFAGDAAPHLVKSMPAKLNSVTSEPSGCSLPCHTRPNCRLILRKRGARLVRGAPAESCCSVDLISSSIGEPTEG